MTYNSIDRNTVPTDLTSNAADQPVAHAIAPADRTRRDMLKALVGAPFASLAFAQNLIAQDQPTTSDGGPFVPTPWVIVDEMLKLAEIKPGDIVYDLGSGDGRLVIEAAKRYGARGVGLERDPNLVTYSQKQAASQNVADRVKFVSGDLFDASLQDASVITMYLLPRLMPRLVPKLRAELPVGARIVSHDYALTPWPADKTVTFDTEEKLMISGMTHTTLLYYVVPARVGGTWSLAAPPGFAKDPIILVIDQAPDRLTGTAIIGEHDTPLRDMTVRSDSIRFSLLYGGRVTEFRGKIDAAGMRGESRTRNDTGSWTARRRSG
jgi:SAM-dependent methyltransferase